MSMWEKPESDILIYTPFMGRVLLGTPLVEDNPRRTPTLATDGRTIWFNREFCEARNEAQRCGLWVHECLHILLGHNVRRGAREQSKWNRACDYEVNQYVLAAGYALPPSCLYDPKYDGMDAETIYELLPDDPCYCGCAVMDMTGENGRPLTPEEMKAVRESVEKLQAASRWGNMPDVLERALERAIRPRYTAADRIAQWLDPLLIEAEDWTRPHRDYPDEYLPSRQIERRGHIAVAIDTSGSINDSQLKQFVDECGGVLERAGRITVIYADAAVASVVECTSLSDLELAKPKGGGGTDFCPALARAASLEDVAGCVYLTDGAGTFPASCAVPVLWVLTTDCAVPFGARAVLRGESDNA
jgi:predicted metal-dependent peptidase